MPRKNSLEIIKLSSPNFSERIEGTSVSFLIIHSTETDFETSLKIFMDEASDYPVSAHYLINRGGETYALVDPEYRAWHAGKTSAWSNLESMNTYSVGIELVRHGDQDFTQAQMDSLFLVSRDICTRYRVPPAHVLGHSDVALQRKVDPGSRFDWQWLASRGVGLYPEIGEAGKIFARDYQRLLEAARDFTTVDDFDLSRADSLYLQQELIKIGYVLGHGKEIDPKLPFALQSFKWRFC